MKFVLNRKKDIVEICALKNITLNQSRWLNQTFIENVSFYILTLVLKADYCNVFYNCILLCCRLRLKRFLSLGVKDDVSGSRVLPIIYSSLRPFKVKSLDTISVSWSLSSKSDLVSWSCDFTLTQRLWPEGKLPS